MTIEQRWVEKLRSLPPDQQQEALNFVESLQAKHQISSNTRSEELSHQSQFPLRGKVLYYEDPFEPAVPLEDWAIFS